MSGALLGASAGAAAAPDASTAVAVPGNVPVALDRATRLPVSMAPDAPLTLTIVLNRSDQSSFDAFLRGVQDPASPSFRQYLAPREIADRFGPTPAAYGAVLDWLRREGFEVLEGSVNRLTVTVRGRRAQVERVLGIRLDDYRLDDRTFYSNDRDPHLPADVAPHVQAVVGLSNLARPVRAQTTFYAAQMVQFLRGLRVEDLAFACWLAWKLTNTDILEALKGVASLEDELQKIDFQSAFVTFLRYACIADELNMLNRLAAGLPLPPSLPLPPPFEESALSRRRARPGAATAAVEPGAGQVIGLLEFDNFNPSDVRDFLDFIGYPARFAQLSQVHVAGGAGPPGADQSEVLLDIDTVLSLAPGAQVVVYDGPFTGRGSFQTMFNAMIGDGVTIISNSWAYCEDQTTLADVQSLDSILASAAASGITVLTSAGDNGSTCLNGSANTVHVPAGSPNVTAVGGASSTRSIGGAYGSQRWWDGSADIVPGGQGGFGVSRFFARPAYQDGLTSASTRSVPDVAAPADPASGVFICQASAGGCPTNLLYGGTSIAAPIWAAIVAVLNQQQNRQLGFLNPLLYPLANTTAFHSAAELGSDFAHVGLGTPNVGVLHLALTNGTAGAVSVAASYATSYPPLVVADGSSKAGVAVVLVDAGGNSVSGQAVQLTADSGSHAVVTALNTVSNVSNGAALFTVTNTTPELVTLTATVGGTPLAQRPAVLFIALPAASAAISASPTTVSADGSAATTITVTLQDAHGQPAVGKLIGLSQGNGGSIVSGATGRTDAAGRATFTATDVIAETVTYTATDVTDGSLAVPGSAVVTYVNAGSNPCNIGLGTAAPGYVVSTFASGFVGQCIGPIGIAFDGAGQLLVGNYPTGVVYRFGPEGGAADPAHRVNSVPIPGNLAALAFTRDGRLYAAVQAADQVVELDPATAAVLRVVATLDGATALAVDPLSGDLFVTNFDGVFRITGFASGPGTVAPYFSRLFGDGIAFGPDGTLYYKADGGSAGSIYAITGTDKPQPATGTRVAGVPNGDGIAIEPNPADPSKPFLYVNRTDGIITKVDTSTSPGTTTDIYTGGSRGDFVTVGPDGCLYATQTDRVLVLTKADGSCGLTPVSPVPQIVLTPAVSTPAQGGATSLTATLKNVPSAGGVPLTFIVGGPNASAQLATTGAGGVATLSYAGVLTGTDQVTVTARVNGQTLRSNPAEVTWAPGAHTTFLSLNGSPTSGTPNVPLTLTATLVDVSESPAAPVSRASVSFDVAGQTCTALTDSDGKVACAFTPTAAAGSYPLLASFAGAAQLLPSTDRRTVDLLDAPGSGPFDGDVYACYRATLKKPHTKFVRRTVSLKDELGGPDLFDVTAVASICNPASLDGRAISFSEVHEQAFKIALHKGEPKIEKTRHATIDPFGTRVLSISGPATLLEVTRAAMGVTPPAPFASDPTVEPSVNRFKCYRASLAKGQPKFVPPPPARIVDELLPAGESLTIGRPTRLCMPVDENHQTPGAESRTGHLVCYRAKLPKGAPALPEATVSTNPAGFGPYTLETHAIAELCVPAVTHPQ